jgi:hypothetical protein
MTGLPHGRRDFAFRAIFVTLQQYSKTFMWKMLTGLPRGRIDFAFRAKFATLQQ